MSNMRAWNRFFNEKYNSFCEMVGGIEGNEVLELCATKAATDYADSMVAAGELVKDDPFNDSQWHKVRA